MPRPKIRRARARRPMGGVLARPHRVSALPILLALVGGSGASCPSKSTDCKHESSERCLWEAGVAPPALPPSETNSEGESDFGEDGVASEPTRLDEALTQMVSIIGAGLEWSLVDERARALCSEPPHEPKLGPDMPPPTAEAWTCAMRELDIGEHALDLEASNGVLSLSALDLGDAESAELFELTQRHFDDWCAGETFKEFEGEGLAEFYRCSLPEGPYLVIARFPRDLKTGLWQVSIAIVDAG